MKLTESHLRRIVKEELINVLSQDDKLQEGIMDKILLSLPVLGMLAGAGGMAVGSGMDYASSGGAPTEQNVAQQITKSDKQKVENAINDANKAFSYDQNTKTIKYNKTGSTWKVPDNAIKGAKVILDSNEITDKDEKEQMLQKNAHDIKAYNNFIKSLSSDKVVKDYAHKYDVAEMLMAGSLGLFFVSLILYPFANPVGSGYGGRRLTATQLAAIAGAT